MIGRYPGLQENRRPLSQNGWNGLLSPCPLTPLKRIFRCGARMSALPPKADMATAVQNVRLVPRADIPPAL